MAKSTRSKVKRSYRRVKRLDSVFAAVDAARVQRLHAKLAAKLTQDVEGDEIMERTEQAGDESGWSLFLDCLGLVDPDQVKLETRDGMGIGDCGLNSSLAWLLSPDQ